MTTIVSRERSLARAAGIGALWGIGHTATLLAVAGVLILLHLALPPWLGLSFEFAVALMLILLGFMSMRGRLPSPTASVRRPFLIGVVHGLAGSGAAALLVMTAIADARWQMVYLLVFGAGTVAGMGLVTTAIALPSLRASERVVGLQRTLRVCAGVASLAFGLVLAYRVGVVDGLFTQTPHWVPQ
ncbi:MAG: hypothetical protein NVS1B4_00840 [Gemmatimonadaceae bacterium]